MSTWKALAGEEVVLFARSLDYSNGNVNNVPIDMTDGLSVRCLGILNDSISKLISNNLSSKGIEKANVEAGLSKVKSKWDYFMAEFADVNI